MAAICPMPSATPEEMYPSCRRSVISSCKITNTSFCNYDLQTCRIDFSDKAYLLIVKTLWKTLSELRHLLGRIFNGPSIQIDGTPSPSGQRVVYFCRFDTNTLSPDLDRSNDFSNWGNVVVKVSQDVSPQQIAYLQKEIEILNGLQSPHYPRLLYNNIYTHDPETEAPLDFRIFVTIEEHIVSKVARDLTSKYRTQAELIELLKRLVMPFPCCGNIQSDSSPRFEA